MRLLALILVAASLFAADAPLQLTIVYDTKAFRPDLGAEWGLSILVDYRDQRILFDVGAKPQMFLDNLTKLGIDKSSIQKTFISHAEIRHSAVYKLLPSGFVTFLDSLSDSKTYPEADAVGLHVTPVEKAGEIGPGIYTSGPILGSPSEQAIVIETPQGIVMLVSCAHPGIARMVETVEKERNVKSIRMLVGGLHLYEQPDDVVQAVPGQLKKLNVQSVMLGHCTGDRALRAFQQAYGDRCGTLGAGKRIVLD